MTGARHLSVGMDHQQRAGVRQLRDPTRRGKTYRRVAPGYQVLPHRASGRRAAGGEHEPEKLVGRFRGHPIRSCDVRLLVRVKIDDDRVPVSAPLPTRIAGEDAGAQLAAIRGVDLVDGRGTQRDGPLTYRGLGVVVLREVLDETQ